MKRSTIILILASFMLCPILANSQNSGATPKTIAGDLLKLANKIQASQMTRQDRDSISEALASIAGQVQDRYNVGALCDTDCEKKFGVSPRGKKK